MSNINQEYRNWRCQADGPPNFRSWLLQKARQEGKSFRLMLLELAGLAAANEQAKPNSIVDQLLIPTVFPDLHFFSAWIREWLALDIDCEVFSEVLLKQAHDQGYGQLYLFVADNVIERFGAGHDKDFLVWCVELGVKGVQLDVFYSDCQACGLDLSLPEDLAGEFKARLSQVNDKQGYSGSGPSTGSKGLSGKKGPLQSGQARTGHTGKTVKRTGQKRKKLLLKKDAFDRVFGKAGSVKTKSLSQEVVPDQAGAGESEYMIPLDVHLPENVLRAVIFHEAEELADKTGISHEEAIYAIRRLLALWQALAQEPEDPEIPDSLLKIKDTSKIFKD